MFDAFKEHERKFEDWIIDGYPDVKGETKEFIENLVSDKRKKRLWAHQEKAILRTIYSYEILGKRNLLLNIVTGGGKTAIIAATTAWLKMSHNVNKFLILVPNLIVRDRLELDFRAERHEDLVFNKFELFPEHHKHLVNELNLHVLEAGSDPQGIVTSGIILGNIQQFYSSNISGQRNLATMMNFTAELAVFNDEAHNTPAPEYTETLLKLSPKCLFRLDTTATPDRADGRNPDSEMIIHYDISQALDDKIIKSIVVYEPEVKAVELTYTNVETGEKRVVTELDKEFKEAERNLEPFRWLLDEEPMKMQLAISLQRLAEQKRRAKERYKPVLFVVTMSIDEAKRAKKILENNFDLKGRVLLVTEDTGDIIVGNKPTGEPITARESAGTIGHIDSPFDAVVSVLMLREGWDVREVSVILLLRKFSSPVYGQQVIGRGLRRIVWEETEPEILAVVDHPKLQHDWLWRLVAVSKIRQNVNPDDLFGDEDLPEKPKIQRLTKPENFIVIPSPEYETKIDFDKFKKSIPDDKIETNWRNILDSIEYKKEKWTISKVKLEQIRQKYLDKTRRMEVITDEDIMESGGEPEEIREREDLEESLKQEVLSMASGLLIEAGFGGLKKGVLYSVIMDHIIKKIFNGKPLNEAKITDIEIALQYMEEIRKSFTKPIIAGILSDKNADK